MRLHLSLLAVLAAILLAPASAHAFTLGTADSLTATSAELSASAALGAKASRIFIDPNAPLAAYDAAIAARRADGMEPQIVIGGLYAGDAPTVAQAVAIYRRWPYAYSISIVNEPELAGWAGKLCALRSRFNAIYAALHAAGARRVLLGEFSPHHTLGALEAMLRCGRIKADGFAWHAYDFDREFEGRITNLKHISRMLRHYASARLLRTGAGHSLPMYVTEYGQATRGRWAVNEGVALFRWRRALRLVRQYGVREIVAYGVHQADGASSWDTSLIQTDGRRRPAYAAVARAR